MDLYVLTKQAKSNNSSLLKIINLFTPKINKSLSQTDFQNREDLSQEIKLQLIKDIRNYDADGVPGFFQMFESLKKTNDIRNILKNSFSFVYSTKLI